MLVAVFALFYLRVAKSAAHVPVDTRLNSRTSVQLVEAGFVSVYFAVLLLKTALVLAFVLALVKRPADVGVCVSEMKNSWTHALAAQPVLVVTMAIVLEAVLADFV